MAHPRRKRTRLDGFDYTTPGCYFVTINTASPGAWFGTVSDGSLLPNEAGRMVSEVWNHLPDRFPGILVDAFVAMPDHIHGIVMLGTDPRIDTIPSLSDVIGAFKSISSVNYGRGVRSHGWRPYNDHFWHRSFRDTIIRSNRALETFRDYIDGNPGRWSEKHE